MKDLLVVTGCSEERGTLAEYRQQLLAAGIDLHVEPIVDMPYTYGLPGNLGWKLDKWEALVRRFEEWKRLVFTDAWDVTFYGTKAQVIGKVPERGLLWGAEKGCAPDFDGHYRRGIQGDTPWRFANGGLCAGVPREYLRWIQAVREHPAYDPELVDQEMMYKLQLEKNPLMVIDSNTELFFCMIHGYEELTFIAKRPYNIWCDTRPNFIHANGGCDTSRWEMLKRRA